MRAVATKLSRDPSMTARRREPLFVHPRIAPQPPPAREYRGYRCHHHLRQVFARSIHLLSNNVLAKIVAIQMLLLILCRQSASQEFNAHYGNTQSDRGRRSDIRTEAAKLAARRGIRADLLLEERRMEELCRRPA